MLTGNEFYTRPNHYNRVLKKYNSKYYLLEEKDLNYNTIRSDILMTEEQIQNYLQDQENILPYIEKSITSHLKMLEIEKQEEEKRRQQEEEYNNTFGYADNFSPMQKGKVLKTLNKKYNYYDNGKYIGNMSRKDFIKTMLEKGCKIEHEANVRYWAKNGEIKIKPNEYKLIEKEGEYYAITKTEYQFAKYLLAYVI